MTIFSCVDQFFSNKFYQKILVKELLCIFHQKITSGINTQYFLLLASKNLSNKTNSYKHITSNSTAQIVKCLKVFLFELILFTDNLHLKTDTNKLFSDKLYTYK
jgi:hypothetical protein